MTVHAERFNLLDHTPVVVILDAISRWRNLLDLVADGAKDFVSRDPGCLWFFWRRHYYKVVCRCYAVWFVRCCNVDFQSFYSVSKKKLLEGLISDKKVEQASCIASSWPLQSQSRVADSGP